MAAKAWDKAGDSEGWTSQVALEGEEEVGSPNSGTTMDAEVVEGMFLGVVRHLPSTWAHILHPLPLAKTRVASMV